MNERIIILPQDGRVCVAASQTLYFEKIIPNKTKPENLKGRARNS